MQQYLYEFAFEELKARPRHVCPYAVLSFRYKGKETIASLNRYGSNPHAWKTKAYVILIN